MYTHRISSSLAYWAAANLLIKAFSFTSSFNILYGTINQRDIWNRELMVTFFFGLADFRLCLETLLVFFYVVCHMEVIRD